MRWLAQRSFLPFAVVAVGLAACRGQAATHAPRVSSEAARSEEAAHLQAPPANAAPSAGAVPAVLVAGAAGASGEVAISVQNRAAEAVRLARALSVEQRAEQGFRAVPGAEVALQTVGADGCVQLAPGAELRPGPWRATHAREGTYRLVLKGCDGSYRIEGEPFELQ